MYFFVFSETKNIANKIEKDFVWFLFLFYKLHEKYKKLRIF